MADIPEWAVEKAHSLLKQEGGVSPKFETYGRQSVPVYALARYIAAHEEPPVDPLLIEARKLCAVNRPETLADEFERGVWDDTIDMKLAVRALRRGMELAKQKPNP